MNCRVVKKNTNGNSTSFLFLSYFFQLQFLNQEAKIVNEGNPDYFTGTRYNPSEGIQDWGCIRRRTRSRKEKNLKGFEGKRRELVKKRDWETEEMGEKEKERRSITLLRFPLKQDKWTMLYREGDFEGRAVIPLKLETGKQVYESRRLCISPLRPDIFSILQGLFPFLLSFVYLFWEVAESKESGRNKNIALLLFLLLLFNFWWTRHNPLPWNRKSMTVKHAFLIENIF